MIQDTCKVCEEIKPVMPLGPSNELVCLQCYQHEIKIDPVLLKYEQKITDESRPEFSKYHDNAPPEGEKE